METQIIQYSDRYKEDFFRLNKEWIEDVFVLEELDKEVIGNPEKYILSGGGKILLCMYQEKVVGTCAIMKNKIGEFELTKMAVDKTQRGKGFGKLLCAATIEQARQMNIKTLVLYSNFPGSGVAIEIYKKLGFIEIPLENKMYDRANIKMKINL